MLTGTLLQQASITSQHSQNAHQLKRWETPEPLYGSSKETVRVCRQIRITSSLSVTPFVIFRYEDFGERGDELQISASCKCCSLLSMTIWSVNHKFYYEIFIWNCFAMMILEFIYLNSKYFYIAQIKQLLVLYNKPSAISLLLPSQKRPFILSYKKPIERVEWVGC